MSKLDDYLHVNNPLFITSIERAPGDRLDLGPQNIRRRFDPRDNHPRRQPPGSQSVYEIRDGDLHLTYHHFEGWVPVGRAGVGRFGRLMVAIPDRNGAYRSRMIMSLRKPDESHGVVVPRFLEEVRELQRDIQDGDLLAVWIAGDPTPRLTDLAPIRHWGTVEPDEPETDEPADLLDIVDRERNRYGTPLTNPQMGKLVNAVAWEGRDDGWGLAAKSTGAHTLQPVTGIPISRDLLIHRFTGRTYDVLVDVEGEAEPAWNYIETGVLPWVAPQRPEGIEEPDEPDEPEEPDDPPPPPPPPNCDDLVRAAVRAQRTADAIDLDLLEARLRREVIHPFKSLGLWGKLTQGPGLLRRAEAIIEQDYRPLVNDMRGRPR